MNEPAEREPILVIDDDYAIRLSCKKILAKAGYPVEVFEDGYRGLEGVAVHKPGLVIVDLKMPGLTGMQVISWIHDVDPQIVIVVITGYPTIGTAVEAMKSGAYDFLPKPFSPEELRLIVNRGLERRRLMQESRRFEVERELLRRRFVTFVSHQLQSPLAAVHQYLDVLKRIEDGPEAAERRREWIDRCLKRSDDMLAIIQDWLTLSRIEGRNLSGRRERVDLKRVLADVVAGCEGAAAAEAVTLSADLGPDELPVHGDAVCLTVLFENLVVNAVKYNRAGGSVTVAARGEEDEIAVSVADTGVGIPETVMPYIFDEFFRVSGPEAKKTTGTGLGLPICRRIVTELGGRIEVESRVEAGTTFRVRLPVHRTAPAIAGGEGKRP